MGALDISNLSLGICFLLLIFSAAISLILKLSLIKNILISSGRMTVQLLLIGIFLNYIFEWNNVFINILWLLVMIFAAVFSVIKGSTLRPLKILIPSLLSFILTTFFIIFYINMFVIRIENLFDAKYLVVISGMLLGNTLRGNIIGLSHFYNSIKKDQKHFFYTLSMGAGFFETILPYLRESLKDALKPTLATMATTGIVSLPGMMTGNILGGTSPDVAIKYQIMIMIAIFVCTNLSVLFTILATLKVSFTAYGILKNDIFA